MHITIINRYYSAVAVAAGTDATHQYRLQQQLVPLARTFGLFSSSVSLYSVLILRVCARACANILTEVLLLFHL